MTISEIENVYSKMQLFINYLNYIDEEYQREILNIACVVFNIVIQHLFMFKIMLSSSVVNYHGSAFIVLIVG